MKIRTLRTRVSRSVTGRRDGSALVVSILLLMVVLAGTAALMGISVNASEAPRERADRFEASNAAASVNRLAAHQIWCEYVMSLAGSPPSMPSIRAFLQGKGITNQLGSAAPTRIEIIDQIDLAEGHSGEFALGESEVLSIEVHRVDRPRATELVITSSTRERRGFESADSHIEESLTEVFYLEPAPWEGLDFAMLANNVDCIMCHTQVDDVRRFYGGEGFDPIGADASRVRVGSIDRLRLRSGADTDIAGTLYMGGPAVDGNGNHISNWGSQTIRGGSYDDEGVIETDVFGNATLSSLNNSNPNDPHQNLYTDYLSGDQPDGAMPDSFPLPFWDDGGFDVITGVATPSGADNRRVDANEFSATVSNFMGSISGGKIGVIPNGTNVSSTDEARSLADGNVAHLEPRTNGNVVLTGEPGEPIRINGDVAIDGDLIISGPIEGTGSLWVKGNIYVRGDVTYDDTHLGGDRQFGLNTNGSLNAFGITAGGNIVMGDPYREMWGHGGTVNGTPSGKWNFTMMEIAQFNQAEWIKTQPELPGEEVMIQTGTQEITTEIFQIVDGVEVPYCPPCYVTTEVPIMEPFTPMHANPKYKGTGYLPRYYSFSEGDPVPIHNKDGHFDPGNGEWITKEHVSGWNLNDLTLADPSDGSDEILYPVGRPAAVIESLMPRNDWISDDALRGLITDTLRSRDSSEPFTFDGTLYSANSIFGLVPDEPGEGTNGKLRIQGSIMAADLGLLGPRGTQILYDSRSQAVLDLREEEKIRLNMLGSTPTQLH